MYFSRSSTVKARQEGHVSLHAHLWLPRAFPGYRCVGHHPSSHPRWRLVVHVVRRASSSLPLSVYLTLLVSTPSTCLPLLYIVDGTICMAALQFKTHLQERVPDYLGSKVQLCEWG